MNGILAASIMNRKGRLIRWTALLTTLLMLAAMLPLASPAPALAASPAEDALSATISGYYQGSQQGVLDDWEELAAIYASGEDLTDYVLPATQTGNATTTVITALIKGDMDSASAAAGTMVSGSTLVVAGYAYGEALNMIAIEAYNRAASASGGSYASIAYDKEAAVNALLAFKESDGGFGYGSGGDPDSTGIALIALSLYKYDGTGYAANATSAIDNALTYLDSTQQDNGGFLGWSGNNANSSALVIWGLAALGENPDTFLCSSSGNSPLDALLSFAVNTGGFGVTNNTAADVYATKDSTLALADVVNGSSFLKTFSANPVQYKSITVQVIKQNGDYSEKAVTVASDEDVAAAIARALGIDTSEVTLADYKCYINGSLDNTPEISDFSDGGTLLAVYKDYNQVAYFQTAPGDTMGVNEVSVPFGGSQELTLVQADLDHLGDSPAILANIPVDTNSDTFSDLCTDAGGRITVNPIAASTRVEAIKSDYMGTHISANVAVLPAYIFMQQGPTQTATVSVRVEGLSSNVINYHSYTAGNDGSSKLTAYDAVTQALDYAGVSYSAYASGYIYEIGGTSAGSGPGPNYWDGWCYTYNGTSPWVGMKSQLITGGDTIVVYYSNDDSTTICPQVGSALEADGSVTITVRDQSSNPVSGVTVIWGQGTASAHTGITGAGGTVSIPAAKAPLGSHSLQISKTGAGGLPDIVRLAPDYRITVTATGAEGPSPANPLVDQVYARVEGPNGTLLAATAYPWYNGITPLALLGLTGLPYTNTGGYVSSIAGIAEFEYGPNSGWLYRVNGNSSITEASNVYQLNKDDQLVWFYTRDYTQEPGSAQWNNPQQQPGTSSAVATTVEINGVPTGVIPAVDLEALLEGIAAGDSAVVISAPLTDDAGGVLFSIPEELLAALASSSGGSLTIESPSGSISFDSAALQSILAAGGKNDVTLSLNPVQPSTLSLENQQLVGNHPVYSLTLTVNNTHITSFGDGNASLSLPYTPAQGENPENLAVFFIAGDGNATLIEGAAYNAVQQTMEFSTGHFSTFAIVYNEGSTSFTPELSLHEHFIDVPADYWARDIIYYLADRGIINGTTADTFSPELIITRAEYASILARMSSEAMPLASGRFADVSGDAWYALEVEWAAEAGICQGNEAGMFAPGDEITRQDMAVMTMAYIQYMGYRLPVSEPAAVFADQEEIASYAVAAVGSMQQANIINGRLENRFAPGEFASRAEAAQILGTVLQMMDTPAAVFD